MTVVQVRDAEGAEPAAIAELVGAQSQAVRLHQEVRLRLLLARGPRAPI